MYFILHTPNNTLHQPDPYTTVRPPSDSSNLPHTPLVRRICTPSSLRTSSPPVAFTCRLHPSPPPVAITRRLHLSPSPVASTRRPELRISMSTPSTNAADATVPPPKPQVQPCRYKTGKTLGSGSYSTVRECVHIDTGRYYAAKVINKRLMAGREHMVRNEIAVLKRVSMGHQNILTLVDYFETMNNRKRGCGRAGGRAPAAR